jgi:DNA-3-methyladenine glycosylase I
MSDFRDKNRCAWAVSSPIMTAYHDTEWGAPLHDEKGLFEFLILEGAQAGLSWEIILSKREAYRTAFDRFDPLVVANYTPEKIETLMANQGIVRNRRKIEAAVSNARAFLQIQAEFGSFDAYVWKFVGGKCIHNRFLEMSEIPAKTEISEALSKDLLKRSFRFVGPTICYAYMQAVGMVNDHVLDCFRYDQLTEAGL